MRQVELFVSFSKCSVFIIITSIFILSFLLYSYHSSDHNHYVQPLFSLNSLFKASLSYHDNDHDDGFKDHRLHRDSTSFSNDLFQNISMSGIYQLKTGMLVMRYSVMMIMIMIMTILMILMMMKMKVMMIVVLIMMMLMLEIPNCYYAVKAPRSLGYAV